MCSLFLGGLCGPTAPPFPRTMPMERLAFSPTRGLNNRIHRDHRRGRRNCLHVSDPFHTCTLVVAVGLGCCVSTNMSLLCICTPTPVHMLGAPADSAEQTRSGMPYWIMISSPLYPKGLHAPNGLLGHQIPRTSWPVVPVPHGSYPPPSRRQYCTCTCSTFFNINIM